MDTVNGRRLKTSRLYCAPPPPLRTAESGLFCLYRCLVFSKTCPQGKACFIRGFKVKRPQNVFFEHIQSKPYFNNLNII